ncbi:unnamed protein product, partial [Closterium sp. NIES-54]
VNPVLNPANPEPPISSLSPCPCPPTPIPRSISGSVSSPGTLDGKSYPSLIFPLRLPFLPPVLPPKHPQSVLRPPRPPPRLLLAPAELHSWGSARRS